MLYREKIKNTHIYNTLIKSPFINSISGKLYSLIEFYKLLIFLFI
jgi:hypothetical protein